jgi:phytase-like protein
VRRSIVGTFLGSSRQFTFFTATAVSLALGSIGCALREGRGPVPAADLSSIALVGQFSMPPLQRVPPTLGLPFGGISGLAPGPALPAGTEIYGISDAQHGGRIYRMAVEGASEAFRVSIRDVSALEGTGADVAADYEALAALPNGNFLVASEGTGREPRRPPSIAEYGRHGDFIRALPVPERFVPEPTGPVTRGARGNAGFESLALAPGGDRFYTAVETALIQDGEPADFDKGTRARILEYRSRDDSFEPRREFVYEIEPLDRPTFKPSFFVNGLVELIAVDSTTLLALERGYAQSSTAAADDMNCIRLYRVSLAGATDVSGLSSIKDRNDIVPVQKTLLLDLSKTPGLSSELAPSLDNFEGMAWGPRLADGRATLILVSDDNFSARQRTWFLQFGIGSVGSIVRTTEQSNDRTTNKGQPR